MDESEEKSFNLDFEAQKPRSQSMQEKRELLPGISYHSELNEILSLDVIGMAMEVQ